MPKPLDKPTKLSVPAGSTVRLETPQSSRGHKQKQNPAIIVVSEPVGGFITFLREHAVVGLAVGFAIGSQAQTLVRQLTDSFITPLLSLLIKGGLQKKQTVVHFGDRTSQPFTWGLLIYSFINFVFVLAVIYAIIKISKLDKLDKPAEEDKK